MAISEESFTSNVGDGSHIGAITIPIYTFDLNASEVEDLLTIKGVQKEEALKIIEYRKANGFFTSLEQIQEIEDISKESINQILICEFDQDYVEKLPMPEPNFMSLLITILKNLIFRTLIYFAAVFGIIYFFFLRKEKFSIKKNLSISSIYLFQWILFVLGGLMFVCIISPSLAIPHFAEWILSANERANLQKG